MLQAVTPGGAAMIASAQAAMIAAGQGSKAGLFDGAGPLVIRAPLATVPGPLAVSGALRSCCQARAGGSWVNRRCSLARRGRCRGSAAGTVTVTASGRPRHGDFKVKFMFPDCL